MVHRALLGSIERFFGILVEHYAGAFPLWLSPEQVRVLPVTDEQNGYAQELLAKLREAGLRAGVDERSERIGAKIRQARNEKLPYMLIVGQREQEAGSASVRSRAEGDEGVMDVQALIERLTEESAAKA
jgi:threonyl-tRNA synthetase